MTKPTTTRTAAPEMQMPKEAPTPQLPAAPKVSVPLIGGAKIKPIVPESFEQAWRLAQIIAKAGMAPKSYKVKNPVDLKEEFSVEMICLAIMHGLEVGMTPMVAIQSIATINGMPTIYGDGMLALCLNSGLLEDYLETQEEDEAGECIVAVCRVKRRDQPSWHEQVITSAFCAKAGWLQKDGPWKLTRKRMMQMRARGWCLRDTFPDVLKGLIETGEADDMPLDVTSLGSATVTHGPRPNRTDYQEEPAGGGNAPADRQQAQAQQQEPDAPAAEADEGWPLIDEVGETLDHYPATKWIDALEAMMVKLDQAQQAAVVANNRDTALAIVKDHSEQIGHIFAEGLQEMFAEAVAPTGKDAPQQTAEQMKADPKKAAPAEPTDEELRPQGAGQEEIAKKIVTLIDGANTEALVNRIVKVNAGRMSAWSMANRAKVVVRSEDRISEIRDHQQ